MKISEKQKRFCDEYLVDLNATEAALRAGYSKKTAKQIGYNTLQKKYIKEYISAKQKKLQEKVGITQERVIAELIKIGFSNIQDFVHGDLSVKDLANIEREKADAVASVKKSVTEFDGGSKTVVEFKLHDKLKSLEMLGRHLGIFEIDNRQKNPDELKRPVIKLPGGIIVDL